LSSLLVYYLPCNNFVDLKYTSGGPIIYESYSH